MTNIKSTFSGIFMIEYFRKREMGAAITGLVLEVNMTKHYTNKHAGEQKTSSISADKNSISDDCSAQLVQKQR